MRKLINGTQAEILSPYGDPKDLRPETPHHPKTPQGIACGWHARTVLEAHNARNDIEALLDRTLRISEDPPEQGGGRRPETNYSIGKNALFIRGGSVFVMLKRKEAKRILNAGRGSVIIAETIVEPQLELDGEGVDPLEEAPSRESLKQIGVAKAVRGRAAARAARARKKSTPIRGDFRV